MGISHFERDQDAARHDLLEQYRSVRMMTEELASPLAIEDYGLQVMADASPPKWHLAHTTWFFETFVLNPNGFEAFDPAYAYLFNSYYETVGSFWPRDQRGHLSRPTVEEIYRYRGVVNERMEHFISTSDSDRFSAMMPVIVLGLNHEQQHQELLLTDIHYNLSVNPLQPAYRNLPEPPRRAATPARWNTWEGGLVEIGYRGGDFSFDNEKPTHRHWLEPFKMQNRLVTNREYREFMDDEGYQTPTLWLSAGWYRVQSHQWEAPLYWFERDGEWHQYTLGGGRTMDWEAPVSHVSFFEADAFARWAGKRLCHEAEWEVAAPKGSLGPANLLESGWYTTVGAEDSAEQGRLLQMFGDVWEWTQSSYAAYPGYRPVEGALGEYNGKFMSGQQVLRGGSCLTPRGHIRDTYRNFFPPEARWQFSGIRLADDG